MVREAKLSHWNSVGVLAADGFLDLVGQPKGDFRELMTRRTQSLDDFFQRDWRVLCRNLQVPGGPGRRSLGPQALADLPPGCVS